MKVTLIDYTGFGLEDPARHAAEILVYAKNTRLTQGDDLLTMIENMPQLELEKELETVANTIRTPWEMIHYIIQIEGVTRALTHQLVRTRYGVSFAQQSMRATDMGEFEALEPESYKEPQHPEKHTLWKSTIDLIRVSYRASRDAEIPAQDARGLLPTNILTNILMKIDLRALADMVGKRDSLRAQGEYAEVVREIARQVIELMPWTKQFLYPERTATPALDALLKDLLGARSPTDVPQIAAALKDIEKLKATWG